MLKLPITGLAVFLLSAVFARPALPARAIPGFQGFRQGTLIQTPSGPRPVDALRVHDAVYACREPGSMSIALITATTNRRMDAWVVLRSTVSSLTSTPMLDVMNGPGRYVPAMAMAGIPKRSRVYVYADGEANSGWVECQFLTNHAAIAYTFHVSGPWGIAAGNLLVSAAGRPDDLKSGNKYPGHYVGGGGRPPVLQYHTDDPPNFWDKPGVFLAIFIACLGPMVLLAWVIWRRKHGKY